MNLKLFPNKHFECFTKTFYTRSIFFHAYFAIGNKQGLVLRMRAMIFFNE